MYDKEDQKECKCKNEYLGSNFSLDLDKINSCKGPWKETVEGRSYCKYTCESCGSYYYIDSGS